jgi:hypothetical protein
MKTKYAYIAGMLDGEGYLGLTKYNQDRYKTKYSYKARVIISNCNLGMLKWIRKNFGGYITKKTRNGRINWTQGYNLQIGSCHQWLPKVVPYMIGKKNKAILLLEAIKLLNQRKKKTNQAGELNLKRLAEIDLLLRKQEWLV